MEEVKDALDSQCGFCGKKITKKEWRVYGGFCKECFMKFYKSPITPPDFEKLDN